MFADQEQRTEWYARMAAGKKWPAETPSELSIPKNHEQRSVDLTAELVALLGAWWGEPGKPDDETLVFPGEAAPEEPVPAPLVMHTMTFWLQLLSKSGRRFASDLEIRVA
jgi:hypothetical protein